MSGGENQRCAIVRALANAPRIVLADEPTGNLDSQSGQDVFALMREMNREIGVAFVMVTHDDRLAQAADRILLIEDGRIRELSKDVRRLYSVGQSVARLTVSSPITEPEKPPGQRPPTSA